jgi:hypothetical protein
VVQEEQLDLLCRVLTAGLDEAGVEVTVDKDAEDMASERVGARGTPSFTHIKVATQDENQSGVHSCVTTWAAHAAACTLGGSPSQHAQRAGEASPDLGIYVFHVQGKRPGSKKIAGDIRALTGAAGLRYLEYRAEAGPAANFALPHQQAGGRGGPGGRGSGAKKGAATDAARKAQRALGLSKK